MRFEVNETSQGVTIPNKNTCKVKGCTQKRRTNKKNRNYSFCKEHSGLRLQMSKKKAKELAGNNEMVVL